MSKIEFTKTSLHNHFGGVHAEYSRCGTSSSPNFDLIQAQEKLDNAAENGYQLIGMTNHNHFWKDEYEELVDYIKDKEYDIFLIPGSELDIIDETSGLKKYLHVVILVNPQANLEDFKNKITEFTSLNSENAINIKQLTELASMQKSILIPHGNKQKKRGTIKNLPTFDNIISIKDFFPIMMEDSTSAQRTILESKIRAHLTSDEYEWFENLASISSLDQGVDFSQITEPTYIWGEPSFDSLFYCAIIGKDRVLRETDISEKSKYIKKIEIKNDGGVLSSGSLTFSHGLNSIIGNSGSGKTLLLNLINLKLTGKNLNNAISSTDSNYDKMYEKTEISIYDNDNRLINHGDINVFEGENLYRQIVSTLTHDREKLLKDLNAMPLFNKTQSLVDEFNKKLNQYITERISIDKGHDLINESMVKIFASTEYLRSNKSVPGSIEYIIDSTLKTKQEKLNIDLGKNDEKLLLVKSSFDEILNMLNKYQLHEENSNLLRIKFKLLKRILLKKNELKKDNVNLRASLGIKSKLATIVGEYNATIGQRTKTVNESKQNLSDESETVINQIKRNILLKMNLEIPFLNEGKFLESVEKNDQIIKLENFEVNKKILYEDIIEYFDSSIGNAQGKLRKTEFATSKGINENLYPINLFDGNSVKNFAEIFVNKKYTNSSIFKLIPDKFIKYDIMIKNMDGNYQLINSLSAGQLSKIYINLLIDSRLEAVKNNAIILYDQPDNNLEKTFILEILGKKLADLKKTYQVIITTHEPLLVVNSDSNSIIKAENDPVTGVNNIKYENLTMYDVGDKLAAIDKIAKLIDGSHEAIKKRNQIYGGLNL